MYSNFTPSKPKKSIPIFVGSRVVGFVSGDTFYKTIKGSRHLLKQPPAIAFDLSSLDDAESMGAERVEVKDSESGRIYRASIVLIRSSGFAVNRRFGSQWALSLPYWSIDGQLPKNTPPAPKTLPKAKQISMF